MAYRLDIKKRKNGTYLIIEKKYWDKIKKTSVTEHYDTLGFLHELMVKYPDPIAHYKNEVEKLNNEAKANNILTMTIDMREKLAEVVNGRYNFGYAVIMKIIHELELDRFLCNKARHEPFKYNPYSIMSLLLITRILHPSSIKRAYECKDRYFERFDFELHDVYRALSYFSKIGMECQKYISDQICAKFGRDTSLMYFDVTNIYFEIDKEDNSRRYGKEKNNRPDPIVQIALAMDADGIPLHYKMFPGNTHDSKTFIPVFKDVCVKFTPGRVIAVADMGSASSDNIYFLKGGDRDKRVNGYVFSRSVRKNTDAFKKYVLNETGYTGSDGAPLKEGYSFKVKSLIDVKTIQVTMADGSKKNVLIDEKLVVYWSENYAKKAQAERAETIKKANDIIADPKKHNKDTAHGASSYIKNIVFDKKTGEILEKPGTKLTFDYDKAYEDAKYDGYYCIATSELDMDSNRVIEIYHGLSAIEDCFKVEKNDFDLRPVYVSREDRINAHILTCFIALIIMRLIQKKTSFMFSPEKIVECLNNISCSLEHENIYLFDFRTDMADAIGKVMGIDFTRRRLRLHEIKNILAESKK